MRFFRFGSLSVAYHAYEGLWAFVSTWTLLCCVWSFRRSQKKFSEICKKLLTFTFRCAILEANNGFGRFALRSLLRKILTSPSEAFPPMQSSDNFDAAVVSQFLADCGFSLCATASDSSAATPASCIRTQPAFFPSIAYRHRLRCFTLYFQGPHRCGLQRFNFSEADFFDAFENSKFLGLAASSYDDDSRVPFDQSDLFANSGRSDRIYPKLVFKFFSVTPTVLHLAKRLDKKRKRKIFLQPKLAAVQKALGVYSYSDASIAYRAKHPRNSQSQIPSDSVYSQIQSPSPNMLTIVRKAAESHDLNWFHLYFDEFLNMIGRKAVTRRIRDEVEKDFRKRVNEAQRA